MFTKKQPRSDSTRGISDIALVLPSKHELPPPGYTRIDRFAVFICMCPSAQMHNGRDLSDTRDPLFLYLQYVDLVPSKPNVRLDHAFINALMMTTTAGCCKAQS